MTAMAVAEPPSYVSAALGVLALALYICVQRLRAASA
jgi:hypothetical protein